VGRKVKKRVIVGPGERPETVGRLGAKVGLRGGIVGPHSLSRRRSSSSSGTARATPSTASKRRAQSSEDEPGGCGRSTLRRFERSRWRGGRSACTALDQLGSVWVTRRFL